MTEQNQRLIKIFEKEAEVKDKDMRDVGFTCACGKCNLAKFSLQEIKDIIIYNHGKGLRKIYGYEDNFNKGLEKAKKGLKKLRECKP